MGGRSLEEPWIAPESSDADPPLTRSFRSPFFFLLLDTFQEVIAVINANMSKLLLIIFGNPQTDNKVESLEIMSNYNPRNTCLCFFWVLYMPWQRVGLYTHLEG
jgi:hypothetical protein